MEPESTPRPTPAPARTGPARPALEPWALGSLLGAVVLGCCPLTALGAIVAGIIGLSRIRASGGTRRGVGLAWAGIGVASVLLVVEGWALDRFQRTFIENMDQQSMAAVESVLRGAPQAQQRWEGPLAGQPSPEEIAAFATRASVRLGEFKGLTIALRGAQGALVDPTVSVAFTATYERGSAFGQAVFRSVPGKLPPELLLRSVELQVGEDRFSLPATTPRPAPAESAPAESTPAESTPAEPAPKEQP